MSVGAIGELIVPEDVRLKVNAVILALTADQHTVTVTREKEYIVFRRELSCKEYAVFY